jgi:DNA-nicking Smr family endonuclease
MDGTTTFSCSSVTSNKIERNLSPALGAANNCDRASLDLAKNAYMYHEFDHAPQSQPCEHKTFNEGDGKHGNEDLTAVLPHLAALFIDDQQNRDAICIKRDTEDQVLSAGVSAQATVKPPIDNLSNFAVADARNTQRENESGAVRGGPFAGGNISELDQIAYLTLEFPSCSAKELRAALDGSFGKLEDAVALLKLFLDEDGGNSIRSHGSAIIHEDVCGEDITGAESTAMPEPVPNTQLQGNVPGMEPANNSSYSPNGAVWVQVRQLKQLHPDLPVESLQIALELTGFNLEEASELLQRQREPVYNTASLETGRTKAYSGHLVPRSCVGSQNADLQYIRNQQIYEEERSKSTRLRNAFRQLDAQAIAARDHGDVRLAQDLNRRANELRCEYHELSKTCGARIARRVNSGQRNEIVNDLHGMHTSEALTLVEECLQQLPKTCPGGVVVKFVTGRGKHSEDGARIRPAVIDLLERLEQHYFVEQGAVYVVINGKI